MSYRASIVRESPGGKLQIAKDALASMARASDLQIDLLARTFEELAGESSKILGLTSAIVDSIEGDSVRSVLPTVRALGSAGINFVESRLQATHGILQAAGAEMKLLQRLSKVAKAQSGITLRTRVLAMIANIEVGRLGRSGEAFEHLAGNLSRFSTMLSENTDELERGTQAREIAVEATNRVLALEAPSLAGKLGHIKTELSDELKLLETGLAQIRWIPAQFKASVEEIAEQVAGAVAAIQSYDITRQQIEHVREAIARIAEQIPIQRRHRSLNSQERARNWLSINIQIYQLRQIRETVANWISRIKVSLEMMLKISESDLAGISQMVSEREREISARLAKIDLLKRESRAQSEIIRRTIGEHSTLLRLIDKQVKNAAQTRQTLHLLSLNTIVEADRLGKQGNTVLEIGSGISDLSLDWSKITDQSGNALSEISEFGERIDGLVATFSEAAEQELQQAQLSAQAGVHRLHTISQFAAAQACGIELGIAAMKIMACKITKSVDALNLSCRQLDEILNHLYEVQRQLEIVPSEASREVDLEEMERLFSALYTTEVERQVLRAALGGTALPPVQPNLEGNGVELF